MFMKSFRIIYILLLVSLCSTAVFAQKDTVRRGMIPSQAQIIPPGPLCLLVFKHKYYVIEGRLVDSLVNPKTIKSIAVEKEIRAATIYGSRAANGVVIMHVEDKLAKEEFDRLEPFLIKFSSTSY